MKISRSYLGKQVRITWKDPRSCRLVTRFPDTKRDIPRGRQTLATWTEWGRIDDLTEGVIHLLQGFAIDPPLETDQQNDITYSVFPEELVESITILQDEPNETRHE